MISIKPCTFATVPFIKLTTRNDDGSEHVELWRMVVRTKPRKTAYRWALVSYHANNTDEGLEVGHFSHSDLWLAFFQYWGAVEYRKKDAVMHP